MSIMSVAHAQAYASATADDIIATVELNHPTFATPIRYTTGQDTDLTATLESNAPYNPSTAVLFEALAFGFIPPGHNDQGPTPAQVRIDGVSGEVATIMQAATIGNDAIKIIYREYTADDLTAPGMVIPELKLRAVNVLATVATGEVGFEDVQTQAFPRRVYDKANFPALFAQ